jgi:hypothetical protein
MILERSMFSRIYQCFRHSELFILNSRCWGMLQSPGTHIWKEPGTSTTRIAAIVESVFKTQLCHYYMNSTVSLPSLTGSRPHPLLTALKAVFSWWLLKNVQPVHIFCLTAHMCEDMLARLQFSKVLEVRKAIALKCYHFECMFIQIFFFSLISMCVNMSQSLAKNTSLTIYRYKYHT